MNTLPFTEKSQVAPSWSPWSRSESRVVAFRINPENQFGAPTEYCDARDFQAHLRSRDNSTRAVYILEGLAPDFTAVASDYFQLHPSVFANHHRLVAFSGRTTGEGGGLPFLPSSIQGRRHVSFKYHEALAVSPRPTCFRNLCQAAGRHIMATRMSGVFSEVMIARRKCTVWSRKTEDGGWDCLIICDPPIRRILTDFSGRQGFDVAVSPYNGGYPDFAPHEDQIGDLSGPPLTSLLDDLCFYIRYHSARLDLDDPLCAIMFVEKILASHFMKVAEFVESTIEKMQWSLSRRNDLSCFTLASAEEQWSDVQAWERRVAEFKRDLRGVMLQLRIAPGDLELDQPGSMGASAADYRFLHVRFTEIGQLISSLNGSIASLVGIAGSRSALKAQELSLDMTNRSIRDAKNIKALTILGLIFIPFSYTASLFSMADSYSPGSSSFWIYFAVSLPLTGLSALGYWILTKLSERRDHVTA
ncbi:hypothetical protein F5Y05DRAFT_203394 [Hypoxylon sp. FL0543]|nr:hypothetical protein F5Y05DRAFT_203394 [Hypoxylon sp. FL0543]